MAVTAPGNTNSLDTHPLPEHYKSCMFYGIPQFPCVQHHHCIGSASNFYVHYVATPSSGVPVNHGPSDQMLFSSNYSLLGVSADEYARNFHFMDNVRGLFKSKSSEGIPGNFQHFNATSSSSSSVKPLNTRHPDGVGTVDAASFTIPQYRENGPPPIRDSESQTSVRNRLGATAVDPVWMHSANHFFQGNYMGHPFQPTITDGGASVWTQSPGVPYMHGSIVDGPIETRHRSSTNISHSSLLDLRNHNYYHPAPPIEGVRGHSINVHPQVAAVPYRFPENYASQSTMNPSQDGLDMGRRHLGPVPPTGFRIYHSRREGGAVPETTLRHCNLPHLRVLPPDGPSQMIDLEMDQRGCGYLHHEPCIFLESIINYPPPDIQMAVIALGNTTCLDTHPLPEHYKSSMFYGNPQYPGVQHHHHCYHGIGSASNFYIPYVATPLSSVPVNHGRIDQMPSSSNYSLFGLSAQDLVFKIFVRGPKTTAFDLKACDTVLTLKLKIENKLGVVKNLQRLTFGGKVLQDGRKLKEYSIKDKSTVHLLLRLRGGMEKELTFATQEQLEKGLEVRRKLVLTAESRSLQLGAKSELLKITERRRRIRYNNFKISQLNNGIQKIEAERAGLTRKLDELSQLNNGIEKLEELTRKLDELRKEKDDAESEQRSDREELATLKPSETEVERDLDYEAKIHKSITDEFELELRNLIREHKVCRIRNKDDLQWLQDINMSCSPIIDFTNKQLQVAARNKDEVKTKNVLFAP